MSIIDISGQNVGIIGEPPQPYKQSGFRWFHFFRSMIESGDAAKMGPYAVVTYLVIKSHVGFSTGESFPSVELISRKSGISATHVKRQLKVLHNNGYLDITKKGRCNKYRLREKVILKGTEGRSDVVATFDYVPHLVKQVQDELNRFASTGQDKELRHITIDHFVIENVQIGNNNIILNNANELGLEDPIKRAHLRDLLRSYDSEDYAIYEDDDLPPF